MRRTPRIALTGAGPWQCSAATQLKLAWRGELSSPHDSRFCAFAYEAVGRGGAAPLPATGRVARSRTSPRGVAWRRPRRSTGGKQAKDRNSTPSRQGLAVQRRGASRVRPVREIAYRQDRQDEQGHRDPQSTRSGRYTCLAAQGPARHSAALRQPAGLALPNAAPR